MDQIFLYIKKNKLWYIAVTFLFFIIWLFPFVANRQGNLELMHFFETFGIILIGSLISILFLVFKDTFLGIQFMLLTPFMFSHPMTVYTIPPVLYVMTGIVVLSLIAHLLIYRPKIRLGCFFIGFLAICIALVLGGLLVDNDNKVKDMLYLGCLAIGALVIFISLLSSTSNNKFENLATIMTSLGMLLVAQVITFEVMIGDLEVVFSSKMVSVGWGITNNIGMILLFTIPFTGYFSLNTNVFKKIFFIFLVYLQLFTIVFLYSRGSIFASVVTFIPLLIVILIKDKPRKQTLIVHFSFIGLILLNALIFYLVNHELFTTVMENILNVNLDNLNGRKDIYDSFIAAFKERPIFGYGILSLFEDQNVYLWGHSTFLHTMYTLGTVGLIAMIIHMVQKYLSVIRHINIEKAIVLFAFIATDIYGIMDVSYFFVNFMLVLIIVLVLISDIFKQPLKDNAINQEAKV